MKTRSPLISAATLVVLDGVSAIATENAANDKETLDQAFAVLKTFDWGTGITIPAPGKPLENGRVLAPPPEDSHLLTPIDDAVAATHDDAAARKTLEIRLAAVLKTDAPRAAKDFVCRKLRTIGTTESVPALAALLCDKDLCHMARYALELNSAPEAAAAMRQALPKVQGATKVGIIGSLGKRRDAASVAVLIPLLADADKAIVIAAAAALGAIGTPEAATALCDCVKKAPAEVKTSATDAYLVCAERLLVGGKKAEAIAVYKSLSGEDQPQHVRLAATRGMINAASTKD